MNKLGITLGAIALIVAVLALVVSMGSPTVITDALGGDTNVDSLVVWDPATGKGNVTMGSGAATSSLVAGLFCMQLYPTSTATAVKLTATTTASGLAGGALFGQFGTCP